MNKNLKSRDINKIINDDPDINRDQEKIDSLTALQKQYRDKAMQDMADANNILDKAGDKVKDDYIAMSNNNVGPRDDKYIAQGPPDSLSADYQAPSQLTGDIFRSTNNAIYSDNKVIPFKKVAHH